MTHRNFLLTSSFTLLAAINACQSNGSDNGAASGSAGVSGLASTGGGAGQGAAGHSALAGAAGRSNGGSANAGTSGTSAGGGGSDAMSGSSGANAGATDGDHGGTAGSAGAGGSGGANAGNGGTANGGGGANAGNGGTASGGGGASGGSSAGNGGAGGQSSREFAYISAFFGGVFVCSVDPEGKPTRLQTSAIGNKNALNLVTDPSQRFVYVAGSDAGTGVIETYPIGANGNLPATPASSALGSPVFTIEPKGHFLYTAGTNSILIYEIDGTTGTLSPAETPSVAVGSPPNLDLATFIAIDPTGTFLYISQEIGAGVRGYHINATNGALTELSDSPFGATGLPVGDQLVTGAIVIKPSGDFLYTGGARLNSGGALNAFAIEKSSGKLTLVAGSPFSLDLDADDTNTNMAMDPQGQYLYVTSAFQRSHVSGFKIDPSSGKLDQVPGSPITISSPYAVAIDHSGRFVYVSSDGPQTYVFSIQRSDGKLIKHPESPFPFGGSQPEISFASLP